MALVFKKELKIPSPGASGASGAGIKKARCNLGLGVCVCGMGRGGGVVLVLFTLVPRFSLACLIYGDGSRKGKLPSRERACGALYRLMFLTTFSQ